MFNIQFIKLLVKLYNNNKCFVENMQTFSTK